MSELALGQIKGLSVNSNVVTVPSGHTLYAPGHILQVVSASNGTTTTNSSTTYADTGLTATITPKSVNSKILVLVSQNGITKTTTHSENSTILRVMRDSTEIIVFGSLVGYTGSATYLAGLSVSTDYLDSPATTSPIVYKVQFKNYVSSSLVAVNNYGERSTITLLEIAA